MLLITVEKMEMNQVSYKNWLYEKFKNLHNE